MVVEFANAYTLKRVAIATTGNLGNGTRFNKEVKAPQDHPDAFAVNGRYSEDLCTRFTEDPLTPDARRGASVGEALLLAMVQYTATI